MRKVTPTLQRKFLWVIRAFKGAPEGDGYKMADYEAPGSCSPIETLCKQIQAD